jgi:hypothetical protein
MNFTLGQQERVSSSASINNLFYPNQNCIPEVLFRCGFCSVSMLEITYSALLRVFELKKRKLNSKKIR